MRDSQRKRLYDAERATTMWNVGFVSDIHLLREYVKKITASKWFAKHYPYYHNIGIEVKDGRCCRFARGSTRGYIIMPRWSRFQLVILHEIAHVVTHCSVAFHGREFAKVFLNLVKHFMGTAAYVELKASFKKHRVKYSAPRKTTTRPTGNPDVYKHLLAWKERQKKEVEVIKPQTNL